MAEFKGTKGKWKVGDFGSVETIGGFFVCDALSTSQEDEANALLISKAPEMLDFINRISGEMLRSDLVLSEKWYDQAQELIKKATEL